MLDRIRSLSPSAAARQRETKHVIAASQAVEIEIRSTCYWQARTGAAQLDTVGVDPV